MNWLAILLIKFYRSFLSPAAAMLGAECRFYPTCSQYSIMTFEKHSFFKAVYYTIKRLIKCSPLNKGGIDHVPSA